MLYGLAQALLLHVILLARHSLEEELETTLEDA